MPACVAPELLDLVGRAQRLGAESIHLTPRGAGHAVRFLLHGAWVGQPGLDPRRAWFALSALRRALESDPSSANAGVLEFVGQPLAEPWRLEVALVPGEAGPAALLRPVTARRGLGALGIDPADVARLRRRLQHPGDLLLVCGPAGSGKRTFLEACMVELADEQVVYSVARTGRFLDVPGVVALTHDDSLHYTAFKALAMARWGGDADVLVLDRLLDPRSAEFLLSASRRSTVLTSTLAQGAARAIDHLRDMGLDPRELMGRLHGVVSLRRVSRLCSACRVPEPAPRPEALKRLAPRLLEQGLVEGWEVAYRPGRGCPACRRGVAGMVPLAEVCLIDPSDRRELAGQGAEALRRHLGQRVLSLRERAILRAAAGEVWLAEAVRGTPAGLVSAA